MKIKFELDTDNINEIQLETMRRTIERAKHAHFTNVKLRINGHDEYEQADWLKHFIEVHNVICTPEKVQKSTTNRRN